MLSVMPKIPENLVGSQMKRFVLVSSDQNIRDLLWRWSLTLTGDWTKIGRSILTSQSNGSCPVLSLFQIPCMSEGNLEKGYNMARAISLVCPDLIEKWHND